MRELSSAQHEAAINKKPAESNESFLGSLSQQAVQAWQEIGNQLGNKPASGAINRESNTDFLTFELNYRDFCGCSFLIELCPGFGKVIILAVDVSANGSAAK